MNELLMRVVADLVIFLAYCDEEELDPDTTIAKLEEASYFLRQLEPDELRAFSVFLKELAGATASKDPDRAEQYLTMLANLGLELSENKAKKKAKAKKKTKAKAKKKTKAKPR